eukprot:GFUD01022378.1.p1 GENE.GFUD01022378.1~~GFUD01022378.1.p1  ORF type:complete len:297 (-),score=83.43 GFUD01022378.1:18-908(-)
MEVKTDIKKSKCFEGPSCEKVDTAVGESSSIVLGIGEIGLMEENKTGLCSHVEATDKVVQAKCRLKFKMVVDGVMTVKIIKCENIKPVITAMVKFSKHAEKKLEDLEFLSNSCVLDGEELAGSIEQGLLTVRLRRSEEHVDEVEMFENVTAAAELDECNNKWLNSSERITSSPACSSFVTNQEVNQDLDCVASVSSVSNVNDEDFDDLSGISVQNVFQKETEIPNLPALVLPNLPVLVLPNLPFFETRNAGSFESCPRMWANSAGQDYKIFLEDSQDCFQFQTEEDLEHVLEFSNF